MEVWIGLEDIERRRMQNSSSIHVVFISTKWGRSGGLVTRLSCHFFLVRVQSLHNHSTSARTAVWNARDHSLFSARVGEHVGWSI